MTIDKNDMPSFGQLLNAGIQTIKTLSTRGSITQNAFYRQLDKHADIEPYHKEIFFISRLDRQIENNEGTSCYDELTNLVLLSLSAIGLIKENCFNLTPHIDKNFASFVSFDEPITPSNLHVIDPLGKIFFWLTQDNFSNYLHNSNYLGPNDSISCLKRFAERSYEDLNTINKTLYGENGDPLINYLISEASRRTSVFMNNYQAALVTDDITEVSLDIITNQLQSLTPLQFEWFCLRLVERSLENESPESSITYKHTGKTNDGGIDGMLTQVFPNGESHSYYIQAKLYSQGNNISNSDLRNFIGAYPPHNINHHGIFITTSAFTKPAIALAENTQTHSLILIDKMALIELMMAHKVGLKQVDPKPRIVMDNEFFNKIKHY